MSLASTKIGWDAIKAPDIGPTAAIGGLEGLTQVGNVFDKFQQLQLERSKLKAEQEAQLRRDQENIRQFNLQQDYNERALAEKSRLTELQNETNLKELDARRDVARISAGGQVAAARAAAAPNMFRAQTERQRWNEELDQLRRTREANQQFANMFSNARTSQNDPNSERNVLANQLNQDITNRNSLLEKLNENKEKTDFINSYTVNRPLLLNERAKLAEEKNKLTDYLESNARYNNPFIKQDKRDARKRLAELREQINDLNTRLDSPIGRNGIPQDLVDEHNQLTKDLEALNNTIGGRQKRLNDINASDSKILAMENNPVQQQRMLRDLYVQNGVNIPYNNDPINEAAKQQYKIEEEARKTENQLAVTQAAAKNAIIKWQLKEEREERKNASARYTNTFSKLLADDEDIAAASNAAVYIEQMLRDAGMKNVSSLQGVIAEKVASDKNWLSLFKRIWGGKPSLDMGTKDWLKLYGSLDTLMDLFEDNPAIVNGLLRYKQGLNVSSMTDIAKQRAQQTGSLSQSYGLTP